MTRLKRATVALSAAAICLGIDAASVSAQATDPAQGSKPAVSAGASTESALRRTLNDSSLRWDSLLAKRASEPFTYLSAEPGTYVRYTRVNSQVTYVEHVQAVIGRVTWRGLLQIPAVTR